MKINFRKIWYGFAISLSVILLLLSAAGILGIWFVERPLSKLTTVLLESVINTAEGARQLTLSIDLKLEEMQTISSDFSNGLDQLSQNVTDKGLVMVLLPEEKEQKLREISNSLEVTFASVSDSLSAGLELYRSIDQLPFVSLPAPSKEQLVESEQSIEKIHSSVEELQKNTAQFRVEVSVGVDKLQESTDQVVQQIEDTRDGLSKLDSRLISLQASAEQLMRLIQTTILWLSILITLFLVYGIYTQVELIRLFVQRWHTQNIGSNREEGLE